MALHGKEKIWFLVNRILDEREITPTGKPISLHPTQDLHNYYEMQDIVNLLGKLEKEENAVKLHSLPTDQTYLKYQIKLLPDFDKYVAKLEDGPGYLEWSGRKPKPKKTGYKFGNTVDFSKPKQENEDKYISVGQIEELLKMPEAKRQKIMDTSLNEKHKKDIKEYKTTSAELIKNFQSKIKLPDFKLPALGSGLSSVDLVLPPNYEAEQVRLLRQIANQQEATKPAADSGQAVSITYTKSRQVLLNDIFLLAQPVLNGENDLVFSYIYKHPNQPHTKKQLETALNTRITKPLHKIVENLGFKGDLAKAFFSVAKDSIEFRNPVKAAELTEMGLSIIKLNRTNNS